MREKGFRCTGAARQMVCEISWRLMSGHRQITERAQPAGAGAEAHRRPWNYCRESTAEQKPGIRVCDCDLSHAPTRDRRVNLSELTGTEYNGCFRYTAMTALKICDYRKAITMNDKGGRIPGTYKLFTGD